MLIVLIMPITVISMLMYNKVCNILDVILSMKKDSMKLETYEKSIAKCTAKIEDHLENN